MYKSLTLAFFLLAVVFASGQVQDDNTRHLRGDDLQAVIEQADEADLPQSFKLDVKEEESPCGSPICVCSKPLGLCNFIAYSCCGRPISTEGDINVYNCSNSHCGY